jgi:hypothetical protein
MNTFLFATAFRQALGPTQSYIQWVPGSFSSGVKRPGREADHSPLSTSEVKKAWSCTKTSSGRGAYFKSGTLGLRRTPPHNFIITK